MTRRPRPTTSTPRRLLARATALAFVTLCLSAAAAAPASAAPRTPHVSASYALI